MTNNQSGSTARRAAMFVDYDNLYSILKAQSTKTSSTSEYAAEILDEVRRYLEEGDDTPTIFGRAYGAYDTLLDDEDAEVPTRLHQRGIEPVYVPAAMQNNTSEIRLSIDLVHFLEERFDVQTLVVVTGNRPYLPLVRWIREQGRRALVAAVNPPQTSGAPSFAEDDLYLDARNLLSKDSREDLLANAPENGSAYTQAKREASPPSHHYQALTDPVARRTIEITEEHFGQYDEVYLTPLLRKLSDLLGSDHDPKSIVSDLEAAGAVRLEKRNGYPYNYTVLIVNDDHPDVQEIHEEYYDGRSSLEDDVDAEPTDTVEDDPTEEESIDEPEQDIPSAETRSASDEPPEYEEGEIDEPFSSSETQTEDGAPNDVVAPEEEDPSPEEGIASLDEPTEEEKEEAR